MNNDFLKKLEAQKNISIYAQIIALDMNDLPLETIEGKITGGSINIDGSSSVRRTCSLTLVSSLKDTMITDSYWCFNTKIKLRIGKENNIDPTEPPIIWFEQGIFIISSFNLSFSVNNITINIQGKDKMCRLNGEINGAIYSETDFGQLETVDKTDPDNIIVTLSKIPIKDIIRNAVKEYGQELDYNIIINDLDDYGYELWEYRGIEPLYYFMDLNKNIQYITFDDSIEVLYQNNKIQLKDIPQYYSTNTLDPQYNLSASLIELNNIEYYIIKINSDETAGYHRINLVYNTDLILKAGETLTNLLDKLVDMLGEFEYFYDLQGHFVFQKKKNYVQELFSTSTGALVQPTMINDSYSYKFEDEDMVTSVSVTPNISNIKNDFSVWGTRKSENSTSLNIHARCAIDKKPNRYISPWPRYKKIYSAEEINNKYQYYIKNNNIYYEIDFNDINQLLEKQYEIYCKYQNAGKEYHTDLTILLDSNKLPLLDNNNLQLKVKDQQYDWRELIYQMAIDFRQHNQESDYLLKIEQYNPEFTNGKTGYEQYYVDLEGFWRQLYCPEDEENFDSKIYYTSLESKPFWNKQIHSNPNSLNFWFDFLDTNGKLNEYSISAIGDRSKVINETSVTSIYYKETPEIQFIVRPEETINNKLTNTAYTTIQITNNDQELFAKSSQGISAIKKINELIQNHLILNQTMNINLIPIFYLQPNTKIYIGIKDYLGDYTIDKISYNLNYNSTMSLVATKIIDTFI